MLDTGKIKGIIFDYGGTIDSNGKHWAEVLWDAYENSAVPVSKEIFRNAYVYGERYLATHYTIEPNDTLKSLLEKKVDIQINWLVDNGFLAYNNQSQYSRSISSRCYSFAASAVEKTKPILKKLAAKYPMVLVSNFYGNINAVLTDFGILDVFGTIIESSVVGIRKPDPAIFSLGVKALNLPSEEIVVIGDSYTKDILPSKETGCKTIWLKGAGWEKDEKYDQMPDVVISDFQELEFLIK